MKRSGACLTVLILLSSICFSTASRAEGFFEMLFGGGRQHFESHTVSIDAAQPRHLRGSVHRRHFAWRHRREKHLAARARSHRHAKTHSWARRQVAPALVAPTQLSYAETPAPAENAGVDQKIYSNAQEAIAKVIRDDPTLRPGDAYMTSDGLRVFEGDGPNDPKFVPVGQARGIGKKLRARLAALDNSTTSAPARRASSKTSVVAVASQHMNLAGSAQKPSRLNKERLIRTFDGKTIRFVGGYAS